MPTLTRTPPPPRPTPGLVLATLIAAAPTVGCRSKASPAQCDQLLDRYAALVVAEKEPDASAEGIEAERRREKNEARGDDAFKNCSSEVSRAELECALHALTADALEKCLE